MLTDCFLRLVEREQFEALEILYEVDHPILPSRRVIEDYLKVLAAYFYLTKLGTLPKYLEPYEVFVDNCKQKTISSPAFRRQFQRHVAFFKFYLNNKDKFPFLFVDDKEWDRITDELLHL